MFHRVLYKSYRHCKKQSGDKIEAGYHFRFFFKSRVLNLVSIVAAIVNQSVFLSHYHTLFPLICYIFHSNFHLQSDSFGCELDAQLLYSGLQRQLPQISAKKIIRKQNSILFYFQRWLNNIY